MLQLRDYQRQAEEAIFDYWSEEAGNPLVVKATGTGKSLTMASLIKRLVSDWPDMRIMVATHVAELIEQNFLELCGIWPFAPAGIYSAGLGRRDARAQIIFAGIQTVHNKAEEIGHIDVLLVDECHLIPVANDTMYRRFIDALRAINPDLKIVGLTATPYRLDSGRLDEGDDRLFDRIVFEYGIADGIRDGYLCRLSSFPTATEYDLRGVGKLGGDYKQNVLAKAVDKDGVNRAAVAECVEKGADRRSWLLFCAGVDHALHIRDAIREHGITCETITGETPKEERRRIIEDFKSYRIRALTNNSVLCLDDQTEILTRQGWVGIDDMTSDHLIAAWADDHTIQFTPPQLIVRRDRMPGENMVSVDGRRNNFRVTGNHRMIVANRSGPWSVKAAEEIVEKQLFVPTSGTAAPCDVEPFFQEVDRNKLRCRINGNAFNKRRRGMNAQSARDLAVAETTRMASLRPKSPRDLTIAECHFIGFWLGDGSLSPRCEFSQSTAYPKIIKWFDGVLSDCGFAHSRALKKNPPAGQKPYVRWSIARGTGGGGQARSGGYHTVEPYLKKIGSDLLWGLSVEQFEAVMHGFWMADGNHRCGDEWRGAGKSISGTQRELYELLQAIGACRGYRFTINPLPTRNPKHSPQWCMRWRKCTRSQFIRDVPKLETEWRKERVWCVTSSTGRLITRRGGRVTVVGNTTGFNHRGVDLIAFMRPTLSVSLYVQMAGRGTRPLYAPGMPLDTPEQRHAAIAASPKKNCLVLDFAKLVDKHGPVDMVQPRVPGKGDGDAPIKICPQEEADVHGRRGCGEKVHASARCCPGCGFEFPINDKPKISATAAASPILSEAEAVWRPVNKRTFRYHEGKEGKPDSVKVTYMAGMTAINEWLGPAHQGGFKAKTDRYWLAHGGERPFPKTPMEWLERQSELLDTAEISVEPNGRYWNVKAHRPAATRTVEDVAPANDNNEYRPADWRDFMDDEIPF